MCLTQRRVHEEADGERRGCEGHVLQCDGAECSAVLAHRRRLRDAVYMKAPSVCLPCTQICMPLVIFGLEGLSSDSRLAKDALTVSTPPAKKKKSRTIARSNNTPGEHHLCQQHPGKYLILNGNSDVNSTKRTGEYVCLCFH